MLLGVKSARIVLARYLAVGALAALATYVVWSLNATWSPDMRLWKAFGGGSFFLLWLTVVIGPAARLWTPLMRLVSYRREAGVWFFVVGLVHTYLILDGWVRWSVWEFLGYRYVPEANMYFLAESGFGLANLMGIIALFFALALAATSFDRAVNFLGVASWKWLHAFSYVAFYLVALHTVYFAFIQYSPSLLRAILGQPTNYPDNPLKWFYLGAVLTVFLAQAVAFALTVRKQRTAGW